MWASVERWDEKCTFVIYYGKRIFKLVSPTSPQRCKLFFQNSRSSIVLDWRDSKQLFLVWQKRTVISQGMPLSLCWDKQKILTFDSWFKTQVLTDVEPAFTMNCGQACCRQACWLFLQSNPFVVFVSQGNVRTALRAMFISSAWWSIKSACCIPDVIRWSQGPWGPERPSGCGAGTLSKQKSKILLNQGYWNQKLHSFPRKWREPQGSQQFVPILVFLGSLGGLFWASVLGRLDLSSVFAWRAGICKKVSLIFSSIVLARNPSPSRSGRETVRRPPNSKKRLGAGKYRHILFRRSRVPMGRGSKQQNLGL